MMIKTYRVCIISIQALLFSLLLTCSSWAATAEDYKMVPPFLTNQEPPVVLLTMGRNHKLYYEAYNDASDLDEDGGLDVGYKGLPEVFTDTNSNKFWDPEETYTDVNDDGEYTTGEPFDDSNENGTWDAAEELIDINGDLVWNDAIDYYGYFDSYKCYVYDSGQKRFEPSSAPVDASDNPIKTCTGASEWSGDFLNYLTMSRMDTMRKVLYGGYRSTDTSSETVLERVFIPQDAHTWGKEYESISRDGYDIRNFTPLDLPESGTRHLFASTTLDSNGDYDGSNDPPLLRVLPDNPNRIWDWVAKERPVADNSLEIGGGTSAIFTDSIDDHAEFEAITTLFGTVDHLQGTENIKGQDFNASNTNLNDKMTDPDDYYISINNATLKITEATGFTNNFIFGIDGDDAVEVIIRGVVGQGFTNDEFIVGWYGPHGSAGNFDAHQGAVTLPTDTTLPTNTEEYPIEFRHHEITGGEAWGLQYKRQKSNLSWTGWKDVRYRNDPETSMLTEKFWVRNFYDLVQSTSSGSIITDYEVRVVVCDSSMPEDNCKQYPDGNYKPTGLLQRYGESDEMMFGLLTGSYGKNTMGGVLRKNIGSITDEIDLDDGRFIVPAGGAIVDTINKLKVVDFNYSDHTYSNCGWITTRPVNDTGECVMWGNPTAEMMYEGLRYFAGKKAPTVDFTYAGGIDATLGLAAPPWIDPFYVEDTNRDGVIDAGEDINSNGKLEGFENCSKPFILVLSDIYPTYDSNQVPGNPFNAFGTDLNSPLTMNVQTLADTITAGEGTFPADHFIGQEGTNDDGACTAKTVDDLGEVRGLCPEEPTKQGSYYAASVAYYGNKYDMSQTATGNQNVTTYAVGLASPLPKINIDVDGSTITLVPFAKSVGGCLGVTPTPPSSGGFQPTNTIVDFFVEEITKIHGVFRVNYEDVEQGADHDMDAITKYEYTVNGDGTVDITVAAESAAGCIQQHMGYIISGSNSDGVYLEVRDSDTAAGDDTDYFLDTPPDCDSSNNPIDCWDDNEELPLASTRTFSPGSNQTATLLEDPLFYAAKWGGFIDNNTPTEDINDNGVLDSGEDTFYANDAIDYLTDPVPDQSDEWDEDGNGVPDTYFYVVNPLRLEEQLNKSFAAILRRAASGTAASVISNSRSGEGAVYQSLFYPQRKEGNYTLSWVGEVHSLFVDSYGNMREDTNGNFQLNIHDEDVNSNGTLDLNEDLDSDGILDSRDLIIVFNGTEIIKYDDANENEKIDIEDQIIFDPDIISWHGNNVLNTEDSNGNNVLDSLEDINGNGILDTEDVNHNGVLDTELVSNSNTIDDISYMWSARDWLNSFTLDPLIQRSYTAYNSMRYIFTFIDTDQDMVVDSGEQISFESANPVPSADLTDSSKIYPYLTLYPSFADKPSWVADIDLKGNDVEFRTKQAQRVIDYIRGQDQPEITIGTAPTTNFVPAMRNREYIEDSVNKTWRLGDIVHSSPTVVGRPQEGYHLLYRDSSYANFLTRYLQRRSVVYVGANDGMVHAFNAGFYDSRDLSFKKAMGEPFTDVDSGGGYNGTYDIGEPYIDLNRNLQYDAANQSEHELGAELWAYVPYNLLPHLYWLTEKNYPHVYYNDMQPKVFDAKIFFKADGVTPLDDDHPNGWGTLMVIGMRLGGGEINVDMDKNDVFDSAVDRTMNSAYIIFDITNPESAPKVLAEITLDQQGYTNVYPAVIPMRSKYGTAPSISFDSNDWYLVFGSGPADSSGKAASHDSLEDILAQGISKQTGKLYVLNLNKLTDEASPVVQTLNTAGQLTNTAPFYIQELEANSFVSQPITVDYDLDFNADTVYFGTISGSESNGWGGKLRRLLINNDIANVSTGEVSWVDTNFHGTDRADNFLIDLSSVESGQPITAAPSAGVGEFVQADINNDGLINVYDRERWVYFGTGRFLVRDDADSTDLQSYYGLREPYIPGTGSGFTGQSVTRADLLNVSAAEVYDDETVTGVTGTLPITDWDDLLSESSASNGWYLNFTDSKERNLGQAVLLGEVVTFTTYVPAEDICAFEGESWLHALYYKTGTPYPGTPIIGYYHNDINNDGVVDDGEKRGNKRINLGRGLALTPNIHTGAEEGSKVFIQTSTGSIETLEQINPGLTKSGKTSWMQR